jgi:hypothetical protein
VPAPPAPPAASDSGSVHHGNARIVGAHVYLFAANMTGYGNASISLLSPTSTSASDSIGAYVTTAADGSFSMKGDYTCVPNTQVYMYALGGNAGSGENDASGLLAVLGTCPSTGNFGSATSVVWVNEVSTVAAAYAMAGFATDATHVSSSGTLAAQRGITNAFANAANLSDISSGAALASTLAGNGTVPQGAIDSLANILAACVGSTSSTPGSNSTICSALFANATADGTATGSQPTDTASAAVNIAHHSGVNVAALFALSDGSAPFSPSLTAAPNDFTIALTFTGGGLQGSTGIAIDGSGNAWITNTAGSSVTELSHLGAPLSPSTGFTGGGLQGPAGIAIDDSGNAWVANRQGNSVTELSSSGSPISPSVGFTGGGNVSPFSIAIDASGDVWTASNGQSFGIIGELSNSGAPISPSTGFASASQFDSYYLAIDPAGKVWLETQLNNIVEVSSSGALINGDVFTEVGGGCGQADEIGGIAIDSLDNKWSKSSFGITKFSDSPSPTCAFTSTPIDFQNWISGDSTPGAIAIDGSGSAWVLIAGGIVQVSNSMVTISPSVGYQPAGVPTPISIAIDTSGNVWLSSSSSVSELIGAATPVVTPLATGVKHNTIGSRP